MERRQDFEFDICRKLETKIDDDVVCSKRERVGPDRTE